MQLEQQNLSIKGYIWRERVYDERLATTIMQRHFVDRVIASILASKNFELEEINHYLNPTLKNYMPHPFSLIDMEKAANRLYRAILNKEKIAVFGDYDVDGATSSALLKKFFKALNIDIEIYIPDRIEEGYGPNIGAFEILKNMGVSVIITVDCGTLSFDPIHYAAAQNIDVIVLDHHLGGAKLPEAFAVVNPNRLDEVSEYKYLAAVGVTFLFVAALNIVLRDNNYYSSIKEPNLLDFLDLVALGTVCDVVPLVNLNRAFVVQGLRVISKRKNTGINALMDVARISSKVGTYHLGYLIGPRINAGGRVGESYLGSRLLSSDDLNYATQVAIKLNEYNNERKAIELLVLEEAIAMAEESHAKHNVIIVHSDNWHIGVIGIVAGRIKELYNKPVAVIAFDGEIGKASCRSIKGIDFGLNVVNAKELGILMEGGGHAMAAGFTIHKSKLEELREFLHNNFSSVFAENYNNMIAKHYDACISCSGINYNLAKSIEIIGPFGQDNFEPRICLPNVIVLRIETFGGIHFNCYIRDYIGDKLIRAKLFNGADSNLGIFLNNNIGKKINLVGYIRLNHFAGKETEEFIIEDGWE